MSSAVPFGPTGQVDLWVRVKECSRCGERRPLVDYRRYEGKQPRFGSYCKLCESAYQAEYRKVHAVEIAAKRAETCTPEHKFELDLWHLYRITRTEYYNLLDKQAGGCAICGKQCKSGRRLAVDHDHNCCPGKRSCGKCIRGLLCGVCNPGLGYFQDDIDLLEKAINYMRSTRND